MIEIQNLTKDFDGLLAVDHLNLTFRPGVIGLVGENGAGKSTLFRLLSGVYLPSEGTAFIEGHPPRSEEAKKLLFFLPDDPYAPKGANIAGVLDFYEGLFDVDKEKFLSLIDRFGLPKNKSVGTFSKGMRRQMFIALALSMNVPYLLLDEAFDGVDPLVVEKIKSEIISCAEQEKTIVISSHNIVALQRLADRFVILTKGKLSKEGENEDLGVEFVKYQAAFPCPVNEQAFEALGLDVVSLKQVGSVCHIVFLHKEGIEETIQNAFRPLFIEKVAIDPDEIVILEMMVAKKGEEA